MYNITPNSESMETLTDLTQIHPFFPLSEQEGRSTAGINTNHMIKLAKENKPVSKTQFDKMIEKHQEFLTAGGAGGKWQIILVRGLVVGLYNIDEEIKEGSQANFERANLKKLDLSEKEIPFANFL